MVTGLTIADAGVRYATAAGPVTAVAGVELHVAPGEIVALLGASGSGKSSLLRAVAGLEPLASGSVAWDGADLASVPTHERGFGMMFQDAALFPTMDVGRNVGYGLQRWPRARRDARVAELLAAVGLPAHERRRVTELSGGQAQRVALARSLAPQPRLLLLDEPLSALDRGLRERLVDLLRDVLRQTHTTALYVTHDQEEAATVADRVAVLVGGRLRQVATPAELWRHPVDREVAEFLGFGPFVVPDAAAELGLPGVPAGTDVGLGPDSLVVDAAGVAVGVVSQHPRRGGSLAVVELPDGQRADLRTTARLDGPAVSVRLDADAVAYVPAPSSGVLRPGTKQPL